MYRNILVPISLDVDRDGPQALALAELLADEGAQITLLHVFEHIPAYVESYLPEDYLTSRHHEITEELSGMIRDHPTAELQVTTGHPARAILDWAATHGTDCIVIASHRPGMQDLLLGSTAAKVVRHARCAVHVLR